MNPKALQVEQMFDVQLNILKLIATGAPQQEVLDTICRRVEEVVPNSVCSIMKFDPANGALTYASAPRVSPKVIEAFDGLEPGDLAGNCGTAVHSRKIVIVEDTQSSELWRNAKELAAQLEIHACWSVPLFASDEATLGTFAISRRVVGGPSPEDLHVLETAGYLARIALERERAESLADKQRQLLGSILACAEDPIAARDREGRYLLANAAEALGRRDTPDEMIGQTVFDVYSADVAGLLDGFDQSVLKSGEGREDELVIDNPIGGARRFRIQTSPLIDERGSVYGTVSVGRNVTRMRQAEAAMLRAQKAESLGVLAGGLAHDFNNLLTGILGNLTLAMAKTPSESPVYQRLVMAEKGATRATDLTSQMLAYAGRTSIKRESSVLPTLVTEAYELVKGIVEQTADVTFDFESELPGVVVDSTQIRQVVLNLLLNAAEATDGDRVHISVSVRRAEQGKTIGSCRTLRLRIRDSGRGMDEDTVQKVFDPFFTTKFTGRGLGLAAAQGIVLSHDGRIELQSEPGSGTVVDVFLPALAPSKTPVAKEEVCDETPTATILVIDDENTVLDLVTEVLEGAHYQVLSSSDGQDGVERFQKHADQIDLVVLDRTLPRVGGLEVLRRLKAIRSDVRVLLSSGYPDATDMGPETQRDIEGFLKKPYRPRDLVSAVKKALG